ncbi:SGNH/GDSL hydrolase family protein [Streptomyces morookaense]|uniref:SGNH/GDSL hydrolase family protein n=1 Tax=Streptomyces morookaense TaxID=1970 RepID=A0A7Y7E6A3_STRMO|nr:SGNH/GDSL hydrolase family protein [Streptomyces morookaense]NVK77655.1 SGNH/GDSL hydrolase family protein [Streptomyces morookaense]GHF05542.1 lipase [Streptomyces morookaense]
MQLRNRTRTRWALAVLGSAVALVAGGVAPASATPSPAAAAGGRYVALGDSFTSAPLVPRQVHLKCGRSDVNYPSLTRTALGIRDFTDVSCGGATTDDMWEPQSDTGNPAQLDALGPDTALVTIGIGGNDIGFGEIVIQCATPLHKPVPHDNPCEQRYTQTGTDELQRRIDATAPKVADVLKAVHKRAPRARVALVGYPVVIGPDTEGCRQSLRVADGDQPYLRRTLHSLDAMLHREADTHGALYVDTTAVSTGHDACRPFDERYVEGLFTRPARPAFPVHPNANGERAMADAVLDTIRDGIR